LAAQTPRGYQESAVHAVFTGWRDDGRAILLVLPTGGGKTTVFCWIAANLNVPVLILVHRHELADQAANRLREFGVDFGLIMAGEKPRPQARVQIATVQTLYRRIAKGMAPPAKLVIPDEAHLSTAETWRVVLEQYPDAKILGATATPCRLSGKPLVGSYDGMVVAATPRQLRELGFLCPYVGFTYDSPDLSEVKTTIGDYNERQSAAAMRAPAIVTNIVEKWLAHARELSTVVFAVTREHSKELTAQFVAAGVRAEHLDAKTKKRERKAILARVASGATQVLCNVGIAIEGIDIPRLKCCVLARPTQSLALALQMTGRVRRPWKDPRTGQWVKARLHDHAFVIAAHGPPDMERNWSLTAKPEKPPAQKNCKQCLAIMVEGEESCPECGWIPPLRIVGERVGPEHLDDAKQVDFSSDDVPALNEPAVNVPPRDPTTITGVDLRWEYPRTIEGIYESTYTEDRTWGQQRLYVVQSKRYRYRVPGAWMLDKLMAKVKPGVHVTIRYVGEQKNGTHMRKLFDLVVDTERRAA